MKRIAKYITVIALLLLWAAATAGMTLSQETAGRTARHYAPEKRALPASATDSEITLSGIQTPFVITPEENCTPVLLRTVSRNQTLFQYKEPCIHQAMFLIYKKAHTRLSEIFAQRHRKGHYQYALCQMRI